MITRRRPEALTITLLTSAVVATSIAVALARLLWINAQSSSIVPIMDQVVAFAGTVAIFICGGMPAALMSWALERPNSQLVNRVIRGRHVIAANGASLVLGVVPIYMFTWQWVQTVLVLLALASVGAMSFYFSLGLRDRICSRPGVPSAD